MTPCWTSTKATAAPNGTQSSYSDSAATITKKWKYHSLSPSEACTSSADAVSSPSVTASDCARRPPSRSCARIAKQADRRAVQCGLSEALAVEERDDADRGDVDHSSQRSARWRACH